MKIASADIFDSRKMEAPLNSSGVSCSKTTGLRPVIPLAAAANLLLAAAEGRISQFVRSGFRRPPTDGWQQQWQPDDLIIWDNRRVLHRRDDFDQNARRLMKRCQVLNRDALPS